METIRKFWSWVTVSAAGSNPRPDITDLEVHEHTVARIRKLLDMCPLCEKGLSRHSYALIAMAVLERGRANSAYDLLNELPQRHWDRIMSYRDWYGAANNILMFALRCSSGRIALLIIEDLYELGAHDRLMKCDILDMEESKKLASIIPEEEWRQID